MLPKLKISAYVLKRLKKVKNQSSGCLYGLMFQGNLLVLGFNLESASNTTNYKSIQDNFPAEIDLCGLIKFDQCSDAEAHLTEILDSVDVTDNPVLITCDAGCENFKTAVFKNNKLEEDVPYEIVSEEELAEILYYVRVRANFEIKLKWRDTDSIKQSLLNLRKFLASGGMWFNPKDSETYIMSDSVIGIPADSTIANLSAEKSTEGFSVIEMDTLVKQTTSNLDNHKSLQLTALEDSDSVLVPLKVDALSLIFKNTETVALYDILVESVCQSLRLLESDLIEQSQKLDKLQLPETVHFLPSEFGHFFTCIYPKDVPDGDEWLTGRRRQLHDLFGLPKNKVYFRKSNDWNLKVDSPYEVLKNPHLNLKSTVPGGRQYLVQGTYEYYHYEQNFRDNGWGCAYRSLQTLWSWFRHQRYTSKPIPTHKEIQKALVDSGDKSKEFIDSTQWIGSTEVSIVLNTLLGIDCRIMSVQSGAELGHKGPELAMHFESQGTPIMIGGGVLAHTILGIDYNQSTNEIKFLILDPHYVGPENLTTINSKGWCAWKTVNFWDKKSYYNLCMPIKPPGV